MGEGGRRVAILTFCSFLAVAGALNCAFAGAKNVCSQLCFCWCKKCVLLIVLLLVQNFVLSIVLLLVQSFVLSTVLLLVQSFVLSIVLLLVQNCVLSIVLLLVQNFLPLIDFPGAMFCASAGVPFSINFPQRSRQATACNSTCTDRIQ